MSKHGDPQKKILGHFLYISRYLKVKTTKGIYAPVSFEKLTSCVFTLFSALLNFKCAFIMTVIMYVGKRHMRS